jgi:hypothetical protein
MSVSETPKSGRNFPGFDLNEPLGRIEADMRVELERKLVSEMNQINKDIERFMDLCPLPPAGSKHSYANTHVPGRFHKQALLVLEDIYAVEYIRDAGFIEGSYFVVLGPCLDEEIIKAKTRIIALKKRKRTLESMKRRQRSRVD